MRTMIIALSAILSVAAYQSARGEPANVTGGVACDENGNGGFFIQIDGEIDSTTVDKVRELFDEKRKIAANGGTTDVVAPSGSARVFRREDLHPPPARPGSPITCKVYGYSYEINSPGGDVSAAIAIGRMFRNERAWVLVDDNSVCISACVLILAGAVERLISGVIGIHRPYLATTPQHPMTTNQVKDAYRGMLQDIRLYLREMNVFERLADDMLATEPERVHILTEAELKSYGLAGTDSAEQQRRAIESEARDVQDANQLGLDRREYNRRKSLAIQSCIYNSSTGKFMTWGEMMDCRRRVLTTDR